MQERLDREFVAGRLGLEIADGRLIEALRRGSPALRYGVALVPRPAKDRGTHASYTSGEMLVSFAASKHKPEALRLARFLVRRDIAEALATVATRVQPSARGADTLACYRGHRDQQVLARQAETARFTPAHPQWGAMEAAIEDEIEQALFDKKTAAQAVSDAHARIAELVGKR